VGKLCQEMAELYPVIGDQVESRFRHSSDTLQTLIRHS
jgi:hypothetical protein